MTGTATAPDGAARGAESPKGEKEKGEAPGAPRELFSPAKRPPSMRGSDGELTRFDSTSASSQTTPCKSAQGLLAPKDALGELALRCVDEPLRGVKSVISRCMHTQNSRQLVFIMVGLPARGKSFLSMRLQRFLSWSGLETRVFNVGNKRRVTETKTQDADYFADGEENVRRRNAIAMAVLDELIGWLGTQKRCAIFDATNTTKARREEVARRLRSGAPDAGVIFLESDCTDEAVLEANLQVKLKKSPDYASVSREEARQDIVERIKNYEKVYEPVDELTLELDGETVEISYIKLVNLSSHVIVHNLFGRCATNVLPFLMAVHVGSRPVWLVRDDDAVDLRDPASPKSDAFGSLLAAAVNHLVPDHVLFTCAPRRRFGSALGDGRSRTSLNPGDPSAEDSVETAQRLMGELVEIEGCMTPVIVAAPLAIVQVFYCHYAGVPVREARSVDFPRESAVVFKPDGGLFQETIIATKQLEQLVNAPSPSLTLVQEEE